ncbi:hypothetical protein LU674_001740 [Pseudomonas alloputida]|uniref:Uncharacterized protein n=2 Tax=Pseudomonas TaxID=286 RepID=A0ABD4YLK4_9PSED|nr:MULTISPECIES: hypothetical protein [Pseudomonas]MCF3157324.1 hypothetical protein [Pseudomonas juntendi]MDH0760446.1 hypothetical protein [Pseudomonas juntendi]MDH1917900.1 hypothetical protein [Pseudomonas juntendi]MDM3951074.1 hypothetical protein [Pseudomonas alloputida]
MKFWIATCSTCGNVKLAQWTTPTSCRRQVEADKGLGNFCNKALTDVFEDISPALRVRLSLNRCPEFDTQHSHIDFYIDPETNRYVITSLPFVAYPPAVIEPEHSLHQAFYRAKNEQAASRWLAKYGEAIPPPANLDYGVAETMLVSTLGYPGPTPLTPAENEVLQASAALGDVTLDIVFLIIEVLGWRPGRPVPEDDPGWIAIWAEEEMVLGSMTMARDILGMPDFGDYWKPSAVSEFYAKERVQWDI